MVISGTELRRRLRDSVDIPEWLSFPEVLDELRRGFPPRRRQGLVVFFTGLPSAGKSTIANALLAKLNEDGTRPVTILDGDVVRRHLSSELGFSREHRNLNVLRIGYVASLIAKSGGMAICAPIAPYENIRRQVRELVEANGGFIEVHVATPVETCEKRDRKGLYAKARAGLLTNFTGVNDPYEPPIAPDLRIDTEEYTPDQAAQQILLKIEALGYIR
jgi:sulfate adenylyltransferase